MPPFRRSRLAPASWRGCPTGLRFSSWLLVKTWVDVVEQDSQRRRKWHGDKHAKDAGPAEARYESDDHEKRGQPHRVAHDLRVDEVQDHVRDQKIDSCHNQCFEWT